MGSRVTREKGLKRLLMRLRTPTWDSHHQPPEVGTQQESHLSSWIAQASILLMRKVNPGQAK